MALETKYTKLVRTGDTRNLLSPTLPTLPKYNQQSNYIKPIKSNNYNPADQVAKIAGFININPMYLKNTTNPLSINSFADALFNVEANNRKWDNTIIEDVPWAQSLASISMLIKEGTIDPIVGSIQLANQNKTDDFGLWDGLSTGVNTALLNSLVNIGNTLDIFANPVKGLILEGGEGFVKGLVGDEHGRKQYDYVDYRVPFVPAIALEFISDPVNWVSFGIAGAVKGAANLTGKTLAKAGVEATEAAIDSVVKLGVKEVAEEVVEEATEKTAKTVIKEASEEVAEKLAKETAEEVAENAAEATTKTVYKYFLDDGTDAVQHFTTFMKDKGVTVSKESVEKLLHGLMKDGVVDTTAKTETLNGFKKILKNIENYMSRGDVDFTDDTLKKYLTESVQAMRKQGRQATGIPAGLRNYAFEAAPQTIEALPKHIKTVHNLKKFDNVMTDILRWPAIVTSPIIGGAVGAWKGAKKGLTKASAARIKAKFIKELVNAEEFVKLTDTKLDFSGGKVVEESAVKATDTTINVAETTHKVVNEALDAPLKTFRFSLYEVNAFEPDVFLKQQRKTLAEVLSIIKNNTGLDSLDDYIKHVKKLYDTDTDKKLVTAYIKKLELIKQYLTADPNDTLTMSSLFDAIRKRAPRVVEQYKNQGELYDELAAIVAASNRAAGKDPFAKATLGTAEELDKQLDFAKALLKNEDYFVAIRNSIENANHYDLHNTSVKTGGTYQPDTHSNIEMELADEFEDFFEALDEFNSKLDSYNTLSKKSSSSAVKRLKNNRMQLDTAAARVAYTYRKLQHNLNFTLLKLERAQSDSGIIQKLDDFLYTYKDYTHLTETTPTTATLLNKYLKKLEDSLNPNTSDKGLKPRPSDKDLKGIVETVYKQIPITERVALDTFFGDSNQTKAYLYTRIKTFHDTKYPILPDFIKDYTADRYHYVTEYFKDTFRPVAADSHSYKVADVHPEAVLINLLKRLPETPEQVFDSLESISELVNHGVVAYTLMRSKANVLDDILANDAAFTTLLKEYKTEGTDLYRVFNDPATKNLDEVVAARELLTKLDTYKDLREAVSTLLNGFKTTALNTDTTKPLFVQGMLDNLVTQLERGYTFNPNSIHKTVAQMIENAYRYMDSRLDVSSSAMDSILNKFILEFEARGIDLNLKGAHNAGTDVDHWFKLALLDCEDNPVYDAYTKQTKGKFKIIFDTETTSTSLKNGEVYQLAIKLVDSNDNVVNNFLYHIKVSGYSEPSRSFLQRIGKDVDWFRNTYVNNTTLPSLNEAFTDFMNKASTHCNITQAVWCGQNIKAFDIPLLAHLLKGTEHAQLLKKVTLFDSLDVMTLEKTWRLSALEESHLKKALTDILSQDKYDVLTSAVHKHKLFSHADIVTLRNLNKAMYGSVDEVNQEIFDLLKYAPYDPDTFKIKEHTAQVFKPAWDYLRPSLKKRHDSVHLTKLLNSDTLYKNLKDLRKALSEELKQLPASVLYENVELYKTSVDALTEMLELVDDLKLIIKAKEMTPEVYTYARDKFNKHYTLVGEALSDLKNTETLSGFKSVLDLTERFNDKPSAQVLSINTVYTTEYSSLEAAIKHANDVWGTYKTKITAPSDYFRMAPGRYNALEIEGLIKAGIINLNNSKNIMQRLQHHLAADTHVWLQPRKAMSYQLSDYFDINKIISHNGGDKQSVSFIRDLTKQAARINTTKEWLSKDVVAVLASEYELLFDALKTSVPHNNVLYDDLSLFDKAAIVQTYVYRLKVGFLDDSDPLKIAYNKVTDLSETYTMLREQDSAFYKELYDERAAIYEAESFKNDVAFANKAKFADPEDAVYVDDVGGISSVKHNLEVTKDNVLKKDRTDLDKAHIYTAREAMVREALDKPIKVASATDAYLRNSDDAQKVIFAKTLKAEDAALTEAALNNILNSDNRLNNFIAHSKYSAGFKLFETKTPVDLSDFESDPRFFVATRQIIDTSGNTHYLNFIVVKRDTFLEAWKGTSVDTFYESGARYITTDCSDETIINIVKDVRATTDSALNYVGYSTGDTLDYTKIRDLFSIFIPAGRQTDFIDVEFLKHLPPTDPKDVANGVKQIDYFNIPRADNAIVGSVFTHKYYNKFYCTNPVNRVSFASKKVITNYTDDVILAIRYLCNKHNGLATGDAWAMLNDKDVYEVIKKAKGDYVCVIVEPAKNGFGKTLSGVRVRQFPIASVSDVTTARKYNAHMIPVEFMYDLSKTLNTYDLPKWMQVMQQISALYKIGYLGSVGWPIRNIIDSAYKNHVDDMANNTSIPRALSDTFEGINVVMKYDTLMVRVNKLFKQFNNGDSLRNYSDYLVLYHYFKDTPEQFQKYIGADIDLSIDSLKVLVPEEAWKLQLDYKNKARRRTIAAQLEKLDPSAIELIKNNLLEPEMFDLVHNFIKNGPSAGLSRKLQEQLYGSAETKHLLDLITKQTGIKYIFDANTTIEQGARFSMYLKRLRQGDSVNKATRAVIDAHFDYADKSLAMIYAETLFPFMSFSFKNLTYWTDQLMNTPYLSRELENILRPLLAYNSLWEPDQEAYENYDYSFDFQDDILGFGPSAPWQMINASRLYHLLAGNIVWDSGKDVQHDAGYGEATNDLYNVFKLSPSFMDAMNMLVTPISTFQERLLPPYELLVGLAIKALNGDENALQDINASALINSLPIFGAHASRWGVSSDEKGLGLKHNNILQRMKDAGIHQGVSSLYTAVYAPHKKYNTWYGDDYEYLTTLPQYNKTYPTKGGVNFNPYGSRAYTNPYTSSVPNYRYNKIARRTPNKDLYTKSIKYNIDTTYSDLFHNRLYDNVLKKRVLDKHYYY